MARQRVTMTPEFYESLAHANAETAKVEMERLQAINADLLEALCSLVLVAEMHQAMYPPSVRAATIQRAKDLIARATGGVIHKQMDAPGPDMRHDHD